MGDRQFLKKVGPMPYEMYYSSCWRHNSAAPPGLVSVGGLVLSPVTTKL